jgi:hypothetical protein
LGGSTGGVGGQKGVQSKKYTDVQYFFFFTLLVRLY